MKRLFIEVIKSLREVIVIIFSELYKILGQTH